MTWQVCDQWHSVHWLTGGREMQNVPGWWFPYVHFHPWGPGADWPQGKMERTFTKWKDIGWIWAQLPSILEVKPSWYFSGTRLCTVMLTIENWAQPRTTNGLVLRLDLLDHDDHDAHAMLYLFLFDFNLISCSPAIFCSCFWAPAFGRLQWSDATRFFISHISGTVLFSRTDSCRRPLSPEPLADGRDGCPVRSTKCAYVVLQWCVIGSVMNIH